MCTTVQTHPPHPPSHLSQMDQMILKVPISSKFLYSSVLTVKDYVTHISEKNMLNYTERASTKIEDEYMSNNLIYHDNYWLQINSLTKQN